MAYVDLTAEQKKAIQSVMTPLLRPSIGEMQRTVHIWEQILALYNEPNSDFRQALNALAAADFIPNESGLAGASAVKKSELTAATTGLFVDMQTLVTTWRDATRLALCVKMAGINAE
jgi:hypothetical protein